jgi:hypothetical protein
LWGIDAPARSLGLAPAPGCPGGRIDLLHFPDLDLPTQGAPPPLSTYGCTALSIYAGDLDEVVSRLGRQGARQVGRQVRFPVPRGDEVAHNEAVLLELADDLNLLVVHAEAPRPTWTAEHHPGHPTSEVNLILYRTPLWREVVTWWGPDGLGLPRAVEVKAGGQFASDLFGAVSGLDIDNAITGNTAAARLEIHGPDRASDTTDRDDDIRASQWPGSRLGPVLWSVRLRHRPDSFADWAATRSARVIRSPERLESSHFNNDAVGVVAGPDGQRIQVRIPG